MFNELNILKPFLEDPLKEFNVRELAKVIKITPATASKHLKYFTKESILKYRKERNYDLYKANIENQYFRDLKVYYSIIKIKKSNIIEELNKFYIKPTIILFGSTATGYDTKESDIDLVIISEKKDDFLKQKEFEKKLKKTLQIFIVKELKNLKNPYLINNVLSGIVLQGEIKWI
jgi:predicted nucleotidyltransferase